ncbi:PAS domain S-box protein [Bdellovibrio sp. NC01]|uniref:PAS domain-containing protein n=1 Tax=Bdellovibrio sp. NC01 TaxID=2220073 RepID=UPI00115C1587|nr:PAS domain S-box protein [Bdellovibrio sp. NC01]QDK38445.1 hypothetical protein DOE51_13095 [Bdellovibrio sp. NC01]
MWRKESSLQLVKEIQNLDLPTYVTDEVGKIYGSNDSGADMFGYQQKELVGESEDIFFSHYLEKPSEAGDHYTWRVRKNAEIFYAKEEVISVSENDQDTKLYVKTVEDMSSHLTVLEKCDLWFTHFKDLNYGVHVADAKTRHLLYINDLLAARLGYTAQELTGTYGTKLVDPDQLKVMPTKVYPQVANKGRHQFSFRYLTKHGIAFPMSVETACIRNIKGEIEYRLTLSRLNDESPCVETYLV